MGRFADIGVVYVTLSGVSETQPAEGEWIAVRKELTLGRAAILQGAMIHMNREGALAPAIGDYMRTLWEQFVADWNLLDDNGQPVPCNAENIGALNQDDPLVDAALTEINRRNPMTRRERPREKPGSQTSALNTNSRPEVSRKPSPAADGETNSASLKKRAGRTSNS